MAQEIVAKCSNLVHPAKLPEVEQLLYYLQNRRGNTKATPGKELINVCPYCLILSVCPLVGLLFWYKLKLCTSIGRIYEMKQSASVCLSVCLSFISYIKLSYNSAKNYSNTTRLMFIES